VDLVESITIRKHNLYLGKLKENFESANIKIALQTYWNSIKTENRISKEVQDEQTIYILKKVFIG